MSDPTGVEDARWHAREALERVCARGDFEAAEAFYSYGQCVSSTRDLILGLRGLKAQS